MSSRFRLNSVTQALKRVVPSKLANLKSANGEEPTEGIEKIKPQIDHLLHQLKQFTEYDTPDVTTVLKSLADFSENFLEKNTAYHSEGCDNDNDIDESGPVITTPEYIHHCNIVAGYLLKEGYVDIFFKIAESLKHHVCGGSRHEYHGWENFGFLCWGMINYAESSSEIGRQLAKSGGIDILFQALDFLQKDVSRVKSEISTHKMQLLVLCLTFQCRHDNRDKYRKANAVEVLTKFLKSKDLSRKTYALLILAGVVRDSENERLKAKDSIGFLLQLLKQGIKSPNHAADFKDGEGIVVSISVKDILEGLNSLVVNDANKTAVDYLGGTALVNRVLQTYFTDDEKQLASEILWALAHDDEIKKSVTFRKAKDSLRIHSKSKHRALRRSSLGALWESDVEDNIDSESEENDKQQEPTEESPPPGHVMLSYQWDSQVLVARIKKKLDKAGFIVWMDLDQMRDDMLESMAQAVQNADVVIICMSEKYKDSQNCRSEATYAYRKKKRVIPLLVEEGYEPDGWLGMVIGMRLHYKFCSDNDFKENIPKLIANIKVPSL